LVYNVVLVILFTGVKLLASKLVEQWLKIVKGETEAVRAHHIASVEVPAGESVTVKVEGKQVGVCSERLTADGSGEQCKVDIPPPALKKENVVQIEAGHSEDKVDMNNLVVKTEDRSDESGEEVTWDAPLGQLPVYKITIRDGKQVIAKVFSGEKSTRRLSMDGSSVTSIAEVGKSLVKVSASVEKVDDSVKKEDIKKDMEEASVKVNVDPNKDCVVKPKVKSEKLENSAEGMKVTKDNQNKTKEAQLSARTSDKLKRTKIESRKEKSKEKECLKEKSKDKSKDKESSKERESKDREIKVKDKKQNSVKINVQSEKDRAALAKLIPPAISKLGKIPKKPRPEEPQSSSGVVKKPSSSDVRKSPISEPTSRKPSISIESRKSTDSVRPKTVKTFNSKFRSTGLEEEAKPPPSRPVKKNIIPVNKKPVKLPSLKRPSSPKEPSTPPEKRLKSAVADMGIDDAKKNDKSGSIKLIPPRPKRKYG
jgi:protein phosphatase 1 regulatory subunit 10